MKNTLIKNFFVVSMFPAFIATAQSGEQDRIEVNGLGIKIKLNKTDIHAREENNNKREPKMLKNLTEGDRTYPYGIIVDSGSHIEFELSSTKNPFAYSVFTSPENIIAEHVVVCGRDNFHSHILRRYQKEPVTIKVSNQDQLRSINTILSNELEQTSCSIKVWSIKKLDDISEPDEKKDKPWRFGWIMAGAGVTVLGVGGALITTAFLVPAAAPILAPLGIVAIKKGIIMETVVMGATVPWILGSGAALATAGAVTAVVENHNVNEGIIHKGRPSNDDTWNGGEIKGWELLNPDEPEVFNIMLRTYDANN